MYQHHIQGSPQTISDRIRNVKPHCSLLLKGMVVFEEAAKMYNAFPHSLVCRLKLDSARQCQRWFERIRDAISPPIKFRNVFAFVHYAYCTDSPGVPAQLMWPSSKDGIKGETESG